MTDEPRPLNEKPLEVVALVAKGDKGDKGEPGMTRGARRAGLYLLLLTLVLAGANLLWTSHQVGRLTDAVTASCKFDADIGTAPIVTQKGIRPSLLGVTIVSDARSAWRGLHCTGSMPAAQPSFIRWARYYHLPYQ